MFPLMPSESSSPSPSAGEDTTSADLGGAFPKGGKITKSTETAGYAEWIAMQSAEQVLCSVTSRRHEADGGQGLGLWRSPLDPLTP